MAARRALKKARGDVTTSPHSAEHLGTTSSILDNKSGSTQLQFGIRVAVSRHRDEVWASQKAATMKRFNKIYLFSGEKQ